MTISGKSGTIKKCKKSWFMNIGSQKHDPRTRRNNLKPKCNPLHTLQPFSIGNGVSRTLYFSYNSKIPQTGHFGLTQRYLQMPKQLVLSIRGHNHDTRARAETLRPKHFLGGPWFTEHEIDACLWLYGVSSYNT